MKRFNSLFIISCLIITVLFTNGCEKTVTWSGNEREAKLTLNALANPDTVLTVYIYKSMHISQTSNAVSPSSGAVRVTDAEVEIIVNENLRIIPEYDPEKEEYSSGYVPAPGDRILINAKAEGMAPVSAHTVVLPKSNYEILSHFKFYSENELIYVEDGIPGPYYQSKDYMGSDYCLNIRCLLHDPAHEKNYYRLSVRSMAKITMGEDPFKIERYIIQPLFSSDDPIFKDLNVSRPVGEWPAYFSCVFDDSLFDGKDYEFTIYSRERNHSPSWCEVDLQMISEDFYKYLKSVEKYRCADNDIFSEPVKIYTNIGNGFGILGSLTGNVRTIDY